MRKLFFLLIIIFSSYQLFSQCNGRYETEITNVNKITVNYSDVFIDLEHEMDIYMLEGDIETNRQ